MCCCRKRKVAPSGEIDPNVFSWEKYMLMCDAWREYNDVVYEVGIKKHVKKVPMGNCLFQCFKCIQRMRLYHGYNGIMNYLALFGMIAGLANLNAPVTFEQNSPVFEATLAPNAGAPASNEMFDKLAVAHTNTKLSNTKYLYAFENGKSAVRVCTDLSQDEFEAETGVTAEKYFGWDIIKNASRRVYQTMSYEDFVKHGCSNVTTLALNGGCIENIGAYNDRNFQSVDDGQTGSRKGSCGKPDVADKLWAPPQGAEGWLWHYMIKIDTADEFEPALLTNRSCNTTTCSISVCTDGDCYDSAQNDCEGWYETSGCEKNNANWDNSTMGRKTCTETVGPFDTQRNGYCDCGNDRKVWMCGIANSFKCSQVCKCVTPTASATCDATTGVANTETCSCSEATVRGHNALPDWMYDKDIIARHSNDKCKFVFGRFNTNPCTGKRVLGYAMQVEWIVTLFLVGTIIRISTQFCFMYWALFEDNSAYRIMFASKSFIIFYMFCLYSGKKISASIENEYLQGWPWMLYLIDTACVTVAMAGTAFGASPFPEISRGKFTLLILWITALKEINTLVNLLLSTYYKRAYKQVGDRGVRYPWLHLIFCCDACKCLKNDMPWCIKQKAQAYRYPEEVYASKFKKAITNLHKKFPDKYTKFIDDLKKKYPGRFESNEKLFNSLKGISPQ